jgi:hypothetical protein
MNFRLLILLVLLFALWSCSDKNVQVEKDDTDSMSASVTIVDSGIKTFSIDNEADFLNLSGLKLTEIVGKEYVTFYGRQAHAIYMYDYASGDIYRKIVMKKSGPNTVKAGNQFFFHTLDSIFINSRFGVQLINSKAEILTQRSAGTKQRNGAMVIGDNTPSLQFDQGSRFENGQIEMLMLFFNRTEDDYERAVFDFSLNKAVGEMVQTKTLISNFNEVLRVKQARRKRGEYAFDLARYFSSNQNYLFATTPILDSLYLFKRNGELLRTIYAGVPGVEVVPYSDYASLVLQENLTDGFIYFDNPKQPPYYRSTLMSPNGRFVYRVFYHGAKPRFNEESDRPIPYVFEATLVIVDLETEYLIYYSLPVDEIDLEIRSNPNLFVSNRGIHFRVKGQENEDQVQFRVFELKH